VARSIVIMQDQLDSLVSVVFQNWRGLELLTAEKGGTLTFSKWRVLLLCESVKNSQRHGSTITGPVTQRKKKLANSWNRWSSIWNLASWLLPLAGPLFMLLLALVLGPCIHNAITHFISSWMEAIKLQLLVTQYRPLGQKEPERVPGT
jgi:hypothetical protein